MTALTDHAENLALDWLLTTASITRPTTWFVALHTSAPTDGAPSTGELSGNGYARQSVDFTVVGSTADNDADVVFGPNTTTNWGTVTHASIWDAVSGGNCLFHGALASSVAAEVNDEVKLPAGTLTASLD